MFYVITHPYLCLHNVSQIDQLTHCLNYRLSSVSCRPLALYAFVFVLTLVLTIPFYILIDFCTFFSSSLSETLAQNDAERKQGYLSGLSLGEEIHRLLACILPRPLSMNGHWGPTRVIVTNSLHYHEYRLLLFLLPRVYTWLIHFHGRFLCTFHHRCIFFRFSTCHWIRYPLCPLGSVLWSDNNWLARLTGAKLDRLVSPPPKGEDSFPQLCSHSSLCSSSFSKLWITYYSQQIPLHRRLCMCINFALYSR